MTDAGEGDGKEEGGQQILNNLKNHETNMFFNILFRRKGTLTDAGDGDGGNTFFDIKKRRTLSNIYIYIYCNIYLILYYLLCIFVYFVYQFFCIFCILPSANTSIISRRQYQYFSSQYKYFSAENNSKNYSRQYQ